MSNRALSTSTPNIHVINTQGIDTFSHSDILSRSRSDSVKAAGSKMLDLEAVASGRTSPAGKTV